LRTTPPLNKMPEPWLSNFEALVSTRASEDATTMRLGAVGSGMPSKQQPVGSDASPSSGFRQSTNGTKGRKPTIDPRKEDSEAFKSWKGKKDEERKITMKKRGEGQRGAKDSLSEATAKYCLPLY